VHLALDCARPDPFIARILLEQYPESAFHKSKDGLLPLHCVISSMTPVVEIIEMLLKIFPDSTESMAVDVVPIDEMADPETWEGTFMMMIMIIIILMMMMMMMKYIIMRIFMFMMIFIMMMMIIDDNEVAYSVT
jgi:hypothetical protein